VIWQTGRSVFLKQRVFEHGNPCLRTPLKRPLQVRMMSIMTNSFAKDDWCERDG
jgi:hypothetical protein